MCLNAAAKLPVIRQEFKSIGVTGVLTHPLYKAGTVRVVTIISVQARNPEGGLFPNCELLFGGH
ncbi:hypothetical protein AA0229_0511 [Gluconobacter cerinus NRIC 0229]|nr:hypothetical protein AA0229_0511 [Gluconobacter cerinus NRIC 0229]